MVQSANLITKWELYAKQRRLVSLVSDQIRKQEKNTSMLVGELQEALRKNRH